MFHLDLEKTFLKAFTIKSIKSFLTKMRPPHFGQDDNKDTYSVSLVLFQVCLQDKHFISASFMKQYYKTVGLNF
jgi:hypothetical protein